MSLLERRQRIEDRIADDLAELTELNLLINVEIHLLLKSVGTLTG